MSKNKGNAGAPANVKTRKHGKKGMVAAAVILAIVIVIAYLFFTYGSLPYALLTAKQINSSTLISIMSQKISAMPMANVSYSGSIIVNGTDPGLYMNFYKYRDSSRTIFTITDLPNVGNVSELISAPNNSAGFSCTKVWTNVTQSATFNSSDCTHNGVSYSSLESLFSKVVDVSSFRNVQTNSYGLSSVNGQPCYLVSGTGTVNVSGGFLNKPGYIPSKFKFIACLSAQYDIPLYLNGTATLSSNRYMHVNISQDSMGFLTSSSGIYPYP